MNSESQGIFISERPTMHPARCGRCTAAVYDGRKYVDFGVDLEIPPVAEVPGVIEDRDRKGVLYLCSLCIREIYKATYPESEGLPVAQIEADLADALQKVELQKEIMKTMEKQLNDYRDRDPSSSTHRADGSNFVSSDETSPDVAESDGPEQGTSEQDTKSRYKNVPSLAELLKSAS